MGKTALGESMPYCVKCSDYVGKLKDKFGYPCPRCGAATVDYDAWKRKEMAAFHDWLDKRRAELDEEATRP